MASLTDTRSGIEENDFEAGHANEMTSQPLSDLIYQKGTIRGRHRPLHNGALLIFLKTRNCAMIGKSGRKTIVPVRLCITFFVSKLYVVTF